MFVCSFPGQEGWPREEGLRYEVSKQGVNSARSNESGSIHTGKMEQNKLDLKTTPLKTWCFSSEK